MYFVNVRGVEVLHKLMLEGIFDVRAKREHRRRPSWSQLLLAFFIVQSQNRGRRPAHGFPGVREVENATKNLHFLNH